MNENTELNSVGVGWRVQSGVLSTGRRVCGDLGYLGEVTMGQELGKQVSRWGTDVTGWVNLSEGEDGRDRKRWQDLVSDRVWE